MTEIKKNLLTLGIAIIISLLAVEGVLRAFEIKDFALVTRINEDEYVVHKPDLDRLRYDGEVMKKVHIKTNDLGFVGDNFPKEKTAHTLRVAVLGDSFTEAMQIDYEKSYVYLLKDNIEESLVANLSSTYKKAEVFNFGLGGIGTVDEMKYYSKYVHNYHPDVVVLAFYLGNDISDNGYYFTNKDNMLSPDKADWDSVPQYGAVKNKDFLALKDRIYRDLAVVRLADRAVRGNSTLNSLAVKLGLYRPPVAKDKFNLGLPPWDYYYLNPLDDTRAQHLKFSSDLVNNFAKQLKNDGVKFVIMLIPEGKTVDQHLLDSFKNNHPQLQGYNYDPIGMENKFIAGIDPDIKILNLRESMERKVSENKIMYNEGVHHFSSEGHITVAEKLTEFILSLP